MFKKGDRVIVNSLCGSTDAKGRVIKYIDYPTDIERKYVQVKLDSGKIHSYNENSLRKCN